MLRELKDKYLKYVIILAVIGIVINIFLLAPFAVSMENKDASNFKEYILKWDTYKQAIFSKGDINDQFKSVTSLFWMIYLATIVIIVIQKKKTNDYEGIEHGSSDWAKYGEQYTPDGLSKDKSSGFILAEKNFLPLTRKGNLNILIAGGSGAGKSASFAIPNASQLLGSYVFTDPKGELYAKTSGYMKSKGYKIKVLNLKETQLSDCYNPLAHIRSEMDVDIIADTIVKGQGDGKSSDPFWDNMSITLLKALIYYVKAVRPEEEQNLATCANLVRAAMSSTGESILSKLMSEIPEDHPARKNYRNIEGNSEKTLQNILGSLQSKLGKFDSIEIQRLTCNNNIDFEQIGREKTALYVISSDSHGTYDFLMTIFFAQMIQQLYDLADSNRNQKLDVMTCFILDEFPNVGRIPDFEKKISTSRSRNITFSVIVQTLDQLTALYEDAADIIIANCDTHLYLGGNSLKTAEHFSKALGEKTITRDSISKSKDKDNVKSGTSESDQIMARALMTPDEITKMDPNYALILVKGVKPVKEKKYWYFKDKALLKELEETRIDARDASVFEQGEICIFNPFEEEKTTAIPRMGRENNDMQTPPRMSEIKKPKFDADVNVSFDEEEDEDDVPQIVSSKKKKTEDSFNYDIQKELEAKFDELFGTNDEDDE
ncbi:MAG: type IV secretory system conjugative DNA transfer family protein [Clostridiales bacterium]|nr:type IV secretory system conjugative DNA transfer family protein [Clostridiales bacterium]